MLATKNIDLLSLLDSLKLTHDEMLHLANTLILRVALDENDHQLDLIHEELIFEIKRRK